MRYQYTNSEKTSRLEALDQADLCGTQAGHLDFDVCRVAGSKQQNLGRLHWTLNLRRSKSERGPRRRALSIVRRSLDHLEPEELIGEAETRISLKVWKAGDRFKEAEL